LNVVVTSQGTGLDADVDPRFGRAPHFVLVDTSTGDVVRTVDNGAGVDAAQGAGVQAAEAISRLGAECLVTGHCGPKAFRTLDAAGIAVYTGACGTVAEALEQLRSGALERATAPTVAGHWA
jgi:predicted Fe-Mo cluster-binding NifX family protein